MQILCSSQPSSQHSVATYEAEEDVLLLDDDEEDELELLADEPLDAALS